MNKYVAFAKDSNVLQAVALRVLEYTVTVLEEEANEYSEKKVVIDKDLLPKKKWAGYEFPLNKNCKDVGIFESINVINELTDNLLDELTDDLIYDTRKKKSIAFNVVLLKRGIKCRKPSMLIYWGR